MRPRIIDLSSEQIKKLIYHCVGLVAPYYADNDQAHDIAHAQRVFKTVGYICRNTPHRKIRTRDVLAAMFAAIFHDTFQDKSSNGEDVRQSAVLARECLSNPKLQHILGLNEAPDPEFGDYVANVIELGSYEFYVTHMKTPLSNGILVDSAKLLFDADLLDSIGALGIGRTFLYGGAHKINLNQTIAHFHQKLLKVKDMLYFPASQQLAQERHARMEVFLEGLGKEQEQIFTDHLGLFAEW